MFLGTEAWTTVSYNKTPLLLCSEILIGDDLYVKLMFNICVLSTFDFKTSSQSTLTVSSRWPVIGL